MQRGGLHVHTDVCARDLMVESTEHPKRRGRPPCVEGSAHRMALALSAAPLLGVELSAEDVLLERQAPPKLVHNVAVCSRWSPRYEALHVLPCSPTTTFSASTTSSCTSRRRTERLEPLELRVRALVAASPMVTLLQTDRVPTILGSASEGTRSLDPRASRWSIACSGCGTARGGPRLPRHRRAPRRRRRARRDARRGRRVGCRRARGGGVRRRARRRRAGSLARLLGGLADDVVAVPLSRVGFSSGGHERRPLRKTQAEAYTRRAPLHIALEFIPKLFRRGNAISPSDWNDNQHAIRLPRGRGRMAYANGATVAPPAAPTVQKCRRLLPGCASSAECPCYTTTSRDGFFATAGGANGSNGLVARIHHYMTRSVDECRLKVADIACCHTGHCVLPHRMGCASKWRANDGTHCTRVGRRATPPSTTISRRPASHAARARMRGLFGVALGDLAASYSPPAAPAAAASAAAFRGRQPPPTESVAAFLAAHHGPFREEDLTRAWLADKEAREADASGNHGHKKHGHKKHGHKNGVSAATGGGGRP